MTKFHDKVYALELKLTDEIRSKIGYTTLEKMEKRIAGFNFSSRFKGLEKQIVPVYTSENLIAKSIERIATEM